ncbi:MAG: hypothetical protein ACRCZI_05885 [Cetobacterium sp.]
MRLHQTPDNLSKAVPVILLGGSKRWAELSEVIDAPNSHFRVIKGRNGIIKEAHAIQHVEASIASHIGSHNKGNAFRQQLPSGYVWALTGVRA